VTNDFYPEGSGGARAVLELSRALMRKGVQVTVVCGTAKDGRPGRAHVLGVPVIYAGHLMRISYSYVSPGLIKALLETPAEVVHVHLPWPSGAELATVTARLKNIPVILTFHNDVVGEGILRPLATAYNTVLLRMSMKLASRVVVTTPHRPKLSPVLRAATKRLVYIPLGVDTSQFRPLREVDQGTTVAFLGLLRRTHRYKGLHVLLEAIALLRARGSQVRLLVGGTGDLLPYYRDMADRLGISSSVTFVGYIPEEALVRFYNEADIFVLPSVDWRQEGFGLVALEAAACGRPVITTSAAGIAPYIERGGCGIVVPPGDPVALANAILRLITRRNERIDMARKARLFAETMCWEECAIRYIALYRELQRNAGRGKAGYLPGGQPTSGPFGLVRAHLLPNVSGIYPHLQAESARLPIQEPAVVFAQGAGQSDSCHECAGSRPRPYYAIRCGQIPVTYLSPLLGPQWCHQ